MACKYFKDLVSVTGFEYQSELGGIWCPDPAQSPSDEDEYFKMYGTHIGSMYEGLITN